MENAIELSAVSKSFGNQLAVDQLDLAVPNGAIYGFIGPNGSGKTTTLRMILRIIQPDQGEVRVLGKATGTTADDSLGYLPEERAWMDKFTGKGYLDCFRMFNQEPEHYTWWSYRANARAKNVGWRIDYHSVNPEFGDRVKAAIIHPEVMGSDHCPIRLT